MCLTTSACFHQSFQSGLEPSTTVVERQFVSTWLWGLVPAKPVDTRQTCTKGVAQVVTEESFVNGLVGVITLGIYSPQHLRVTCAA
jgi:hypothetical protein